MRDQTGAAVSRSISRIMSMKTVAAGDLVRHFEFLERLPEQLAGPFPVLLVDVHSLVRGLHVPSGVETGTARLG
ncbi:MAG: hypothetical protein J0H54_08925, partial [Rhizobiales bacterium]|nr:hypothetical protein [Hyphomicrobiales bacterium]